jgi:hypothetical protein
MGDHPVVVLTQRAAPVDQDPQDRELLIVDHRPQPGYPGPHQSHRVRVGGVGLASLSGREDPRSRRELRRDIDHLLARGQQPHRDVVPDPVASLDRPDPVATLCPDRDDVTPHGSKPSRICPEPLTTKHRLIGSHHLDRGRPLVGIHPDHHTAADLIHALTPPSFRHWCHWLSSREGNATSS